MTLPIRKVISLPPASAHEFDVAFPRLAAEWMAVCDPEGRRLGSGGGVAFSIEEAARKSGESLESWLQRGHVLLMLSGGYSRRLPSYSALGKSLIPLPPLATQVGAPIDQVLVERSIVPLVDALQRTGEPRLVIVSGDVVLHGEHPLPPLSGADALLLGTDSDFETLRRFGVFVVDPASGRLTDVLQKPSLEVLESMAKERRLLLDVGVWSLSVEATMLLAERAGSHGDRPFELYSEFGSELQAGRLALANGRKLSSSVIACDLDFFHFGSSRELLKVMTAISGESVNTWSDRNGTSYDGVLGEHVVTGFPDSVADYLSVSGLCLDAIPIKGNGTAIAAYGIDDPFRGELGSPHTVLMGVPVQDWATAREIEIPDPSLDILDWPVFPVVNDNFDGVLDFLVHGNSGAKEQYLHAPKISLAEIGKTADVRRLRVQAQTSSVQMIRKIAKERPATLLRYDLTHVAPLLDEFLIPVHSGLKGVCFAMLASAVERHHGRSHEQLEAQAFAELHDLVLSDERLSPVVPRWTLAPDAIVVTDSPIRWDIAGGWSDTPPFPMQFGGSVTNVAINLNGRPPIQVVIRRSDRPGVSIHSVDLGSHVHFPDPAAIVDPDQQLSDFDLARACLQIVGFNGSISEAARREFFGSFGLDIALFSALPKGSGLGASSILASTLLEALNRSFGYGWSREELVLRTLAAEQVMGSGGGWQDQVGGIYGGAKIARSQPGLNQEIEVFGLPPTLFQEAHHCERILCYYTGITRVARTVLGEIVRGMFLNSRHHLDTIHELKQNSYYAAKMIDDQSFEGLADAVRRNWELNCRLDSGTNPENIEAIVQRAEPFCLGYKLLGAGGGGFCIFLTRDAEASHLLREELINNPPNSQARFFEWELSEDGVRTSIT